MQLAEYLCPWRCLFAQPIFGARQGAPSGSVLAWLCLVYAAVQSLKPDMLYCYDNVCGE